MSTKHVRYSPIVVGVISLALVLVGLTVPPWVFPPIESIETGPAAIEMVQFKAASRQLPYNARPVALEPADNEGSPQASEVYQNVQVLGGLTDAEFTRLMLAITEWVSPEQGCEYCHNLESEEGFASDALYTKKVARTMLQMVRHINTNWPEHVAPSGVTCYTCHRGQNVPPRTWYDQNRPGGDQFMGKPRPWHLEAKTIRQFFPDVPFTKYLKEEHASARIQSSDPLVSRTGRAEVALEQDAEDMYLFMMQVSNSLGVNCTYCHNSRAFRDWSQSTPFRWIAYWGIRMTRDINSNYIQPLASVFPDNRKGPLGDPAKAECGTCHIGNNKPLGGYNLLEHYLVGLTEDGKAPDPAPKEAILIGEAKPTAVTGPDQDAAQPAPAPAPVSEEAIGQSVAPGGSGDGVEYRSQEEPANTGGEDVSGTVRPVPQDQDANAPSPEPTGDAAPRGAEPSQLDPGTTMQPSEEQNGTEGTANAPSAGQPPSNPPPADDTPGKEEPADVGTPAAPAEGSTNGGADGAAPAAGAATPPANRGPAQGTTTRFD
ncbi:photosynthetic reaction center cytochrome PufC [Jiella pacifica]|uniref:Photosynthetic reaction center cytochrome c subunit n=1 Tax=Jiella pacifica TaxID=2696469 RepID=A0A6N9T3F3_9HYPH|nr:photosynthetic reaction center cytochrome PufC [Jiella pacifica]NDW05771.1 photosynthetic reaction center cytochrome c subunit [Jiella pacifica]